MLQTSPHPSTLYLIPVPLAEVEHEVCLPEYNRQVVASLEVFIVEQVRSARRFIRKAVPSKDIDSLTFFELNKHTPSEEIAGFLAPLLQEGKSIGIISEAGCPAIADPGCDVVALAQSKGITVIPLVGPSSILMSLMSSGFNGQSFSFLGYLPIQEGERTEAIRLAERRATAGHTQIFIETPYRNAKLLGELLRLCKPTTKLCIAVNISAPDAEIRTLSIGQWRKEQLELGKRPAIFLLGQ